jgi:hypothetical protein
MPHPRPQIPRISHDPAGFSLLALQLLRFSIDRLEHQNTRSRHARAHTVDGAVHDANGHLGEGQHHSIKAEQAGPAAIP